MIILVLLIGLLLFVLSSPILRTRWFDELNTIGIQIHDHIYTPVTKIHTDNYKPFDVVIIGKHDHRLHLYYLLSQSYKIIDLHHVPVGFKLTYWHEGSEKEIPYMIGTPFQLRKGELVLSQRKKRGFGFVHEEVARSRRWPIF